MGQGSPLGSVGILKRSGLKPEEDEKGGKDGGEDEEELERPIGGLKEET